MKNREIKFRAWHKDKNLIASVSTLYHNGSIRASWIDSELYEKQKHSGLFYPGAVSSDWNDKDIELMQFTGLKDKNGVEIYEGDIVVRTGYYYGTNSKPKPIVKTGSVKWNEETASFLFYVGHYLGLFADNLEIEVIGNIYEHPHLLTPQS